MNFKLKSPVAILLSLIALSSVGYGIAFGSGYGLLPLGAPSDLEVIFRNNKMVLSWTDNASEEKGFKIERAVGVCSAKSKFKQIAIVKKANASSYSDSAFPTNDTQYCYRVRAYNNTGNSDYSEKVGGSIVYTRRNSVLGFLGSLFR